MQPNPHVPKYPAHHVERAVQNYERYHKIPTGSANAEHVEKSSAGIHGWSNYKPVDKRASKPKHKYNRSGALNCMAHKYSMNYLAAASKAKKEAYKIRTLTLEESESNKKHSTYF
eukprot:SAG11_NODE_9651_length_892_cov_1.220681_1_plen_114_part_10